MAKELEIAGRITRPADIAMANDVGKRGNQFMIRQ